MLRTARYCDVVEVVLVVFEVVDEKLELPIGVEVEAAELPIEPELFEMVFWSLSGS